MAGREPPREGTHATRPVAEEAAKRPAPGRAFKWLDPVSLWVSRNDVLAKSFSDPSNTLRDRYMKAMGVKDPRITTWAGRDRIAFAMLGDTGEGDRSQRVATEAAMKLQGRSDFLLIASDVIYPAGDVNDYVRKFYAEYAEWQKPILAIPGNHDWYDELQGFLFHFCGVDDIAALAPASVEVRRPILWRKPRPVRDAAREARDNRPAGRGGFQPAPYFAIDAGPVAIIGIDTGITGGVDIAQGRWLAKVSAEMPQPKILFTGKPLIVDNRYNPGKISGMDRTVDDILRDPRHGYVATIGGDIHNYQRYEVPCGPGRTLQYLVAGGGGAFMHATHRIDPVDIGDVREDDFRCFPLRGDSLAFYARRIVPALMRLVEVAALVLLLALLVLAGAIAGFSAVLDSWLWGTLLGIAVGGPPLLAAGALWRAVERTGAPKAFGLRDVTLTPEEASTYLAGKLDESITVGHERTLTDAQIRLAEFVRPRMGDTHGIIHRYVSEVLDADAVPMYKHVLHFEADHSSVTITCHPATGLETPADPLPVEDQVVIPLEPARAMMRDARGGAVPV